MRHLSLFSGIGGFDLAAQWMGWENVAHCEIDANCRRLLKYYWPNAQSHEDIKKTDFSQYKGAVDIVTGGFPCQPFSAAGKRKGTADERHLWPEMLRAIREIAPRYVVGENVGGLISWDGGLVFEQVHTDLEAEGYEVQAFVLPAAGINAPHRRDRVWFVAHAPRKTGFEAWRQKRISIKQSFEWRKIWPSSNAHSLRQSCKEYRQEEPGEHSEFGPEFGWHYFPTQSPICGGNDGIPSKLDGITFPKWRNMSIASYGNAIVPQIAYRIFQAIQQTEK